ncbi:hypothetical protein JOM56_008049 [Amanita muscaria]
MGCRLGRFNPKEIGSDYTTYVVSPFFPHTNLNDASQASTSVLCLIQHRLLKSTMLPKQYIKGFAINREKMAAFHELEPGSPTVETAIHLTIRYLDRDAFLFICCGLKPDGGRQLVVVLDVDDEEDKLKERSLKPLDSSLNNVMPVLDGPDIWERAA